MDRGLITSYIVSSTIIITTMQFVMVLIQLEHNMLTGIMLANTTIYIANH